MNTNGWKRVGAIEVRREPQSQEVELRDGGQPDSGTLKFTPQEWEAFVNGVKNGKLEGLQPPAEHA